MTVISADQKFENLKVFLKKVPKGQRVIVFCNTKSGCQGAARRLYQDGYDIAAIHGDLDQSQRENIL